MKVVRLGNEEFEGRNNSYLLPGDNSLALVDTGIATPTTWDALVEGVHDLGFEMADVDAVVLTHWHPDHAGLAGEIQAAGGATVYVHEADAPIVRQDEDVLAAFRQRQRDRFEEWAIPPAKREELWPMLGIDETTGNPPTVETFGDGATLEVAGWSLTAVHAPGHTAGLCCFSFNGASGTEAFLGDAILPEYTPNVGGADVRLDAPLEKYLDTLERLAALEVSRGWPGHRKAIADSTSRAREIVDHHRQRAARILEILDEDEPLDAWAVSARLFGDLSGVHIIHGPGESHAHLDHLARNGVVEATSEGYRLDPLRPPLNTVI